MTLLAEYDRACAAIAEATRVDQVLVIRDEIEHAKLYARQIKDRELLIKATQLQIKTEHRLGTILNAARAAGQIVEGRPKKQDSDNPFPRVTLAEIGVDKNLAIRATRTASVSEMALEAMLQGVRERISAGKAIVVDPVGVAEKEAQSDQRKADHAKRTLQGGAVADLNDLAASGYRASAILADPPWHFMARSDKGEGRSASSHYTTDRRWRDIIELPVAQLAAPDATLFMWMVDWCPKLALEIIEAWGFAHKTTAFTWVKLTEGHDGKPRADVIADGDFHFGMGYWTRANPEACWLATRGNPRRIHADVRQLVVHPVMEHSRKPDEIHDRVERLVDGPYLELYARRERAGWQTWGNEVPPPLPPHDPETGEITETEAAE